MFTMKLNETRKEEDELQIPRKIKAISHWIFLANPLVQQMLYLAEEMVQLSNLISLRSPRLGKK